MERGATVHGVSELDTTEHAHAQVSCASWQKFHVIPFMFCFHFNSVRNIFNFPHGIFIAPWVNLKILISTYILFFSSLHCAHFTTLPSTQFPSGCEPTVRNTENPRLLNFLILNRHVAKTSRNPWAILNQHWTILSPLGSFGNNVTARNNPFNGDDSTESIRERFIKDKVKRKHKGCWGILGQQQEARMGNGHLLLLKGPRRAIQQELWPQAERHRE